MYSQPARGTTQEEVTVRQCAVTRRTLARSEGHTGDGVYVSRQTEKWARSTIKDPSTLFISDTLYKTGRRRVKCSSGFKCF